MTTVHPSPVAGATSTAPWLPRTEPLPRWSSTPSYACFLAAVFFLPVQIESGLLRNFIDSRFAPSDLFLALALMLAPNSVRFSKRPVELLPIGLVATLGYGAILVMIQNGFISTHSLQVKFVGAIILALLGLVTAAYARAGYASRILRVFLFGVAFWFVVAWVDFSVTSILGFLDPKVSSRFGGMQFDPNNAGALYAASAILAWQSGSQLFRHRLTHVAMVAAPAIGLALTYSRGGYAAIAGAVLVIFVLGRVSAQRFLRMFTVVVLGLTAFFVSGLAADAWSDFERRPDNIEDRGEFADLGIERFTESHGVGIGLGGFRDEFNEIIHNTALWLLVEMSLVGVGFYLLMAVIPARAGLYALSVNKALALGLLGAHVAMVVASVGIEALYQRQWWMIIGLMSFPYAKWVAQESRVRPARVVEGF